jgi:hypothetical protein
MFNLFFISEGYAGMDHRGIFYHYLLPPTFALLIVSARLIVGRGIPVRWRLLIPALGLIVFFTVWAQGGTPVLRWLYDTFRLLRQWRYTPRMLAAAVPWLALILALCYDDALLVFYRRAQESRLLARGLWLGILLLMLGGTALAMKPILENWDRASGMILNYEIDQEALYFIREQRPTEFLPVWSPGFFRYYPYYEKRLRASFGNPDYRPVGIESTIGSVQQVDFPPPYAFGVDESYRYDPMGRGYRPFPGSLDVLGRALWENPHVPAYAFTVPLEPLPYIDHPLMAEDTRPVTGFVHNIERIIFDLEVTEPGQALVVQEIAYPGWRVRLNGEITALQSLGGLLAVSLPDYGPAHIEFAYEPLWFYLGCAITVLGILIFAFYMLRLDERRQST